MKKSLILTLGLTLGVAGTALAANPFSDVPNDHWSYASVAKLAQAGVVQGYGDDTFRGDRNLTRYEMAEMIAKAMTKQDQLNAANKALLEKLAAEYSKELSNFGIRVSELEKYSDKVRITGEMRASYEDIGKRTVLDTSKAELRTRIWLTGEVNDNWKAVGMLQNTAKLNSNPISGGNQGDPSSTVYLDRAYVEGNFNKIKVTAGRYEQTLAQGMVMDDLINGIRVDYGDDKAKVGIYYGRPNANDATVFLSGVRDIDDPEEWRILNAFGIEANANFGKLNVFGEYTHLQLEDYEKTPTSIADLKSDIVELGLAYKFDKNFNMMAQYIHGSKVSEQAGSTNGWATRLNYGTFNRNKKGSYNIYAQYYDVPAGADVSGHKDYGFIDNDPWAGTKAWELGVDYAVQKNVRLHFSYANGKSKALNENNKKDQLFTYATFYF